MLAIETERLEECSITGDSLVRGKVRSLNDSPEVIESALRKIVHDYVTGWGLVQTQSPRERRRKKRVWNRRASERHAFRRPVWVHKTIWGESSTPSLRSVIVRLDDEMFLVHDLSGTGIGLSCDRPPSSRLVVLAFDSLTGKPVDLVVDLRWRKRISSQNYRCGGTILGVLLPE